MLMVGLKRNMMCWWWYVDGGVETQHEPNVNMPPHPPYVLMLEYGDVAVDITLLLLKNRKTEVKHVIPSRSCFSWQGHVKMSKLLARFPPFSKNTLNPIDYNV